MNETELESMVVGLKGDGDDYRKMLEDAVKGTKESTSEIEESAIGLEKALGGVAKTIAATFVAVFAAIQVKDFLKSSFHEFEEAENGVISLEAAIRANGGEVEKLSADYKDFASEIQKTTTYSDDAAIALLKTAETFGVSGDAAKKAAQDAINLGAATGQSAESMVRFTAMMAKGDIKGAMRFARIIPQLRGIKDESELAAKYQNLLAAGMETVEKQSNTVGGQLAIINNLWGDFKEMIGGVVAEGMKPFVSMARAAVDWLGTLGPEIESVKGFMISLRERAEATWEWLAPVRFAIASFFKFIVEVGSTIWESIKTTATNVWQWITDQVGGTATTLRDDLVWAILLAEYSFRNLDKIAEWVWLSIGYSMVKFTEDFIFFFDTTVPELLNWFAEQFPNIIIDAIDSAMAMIKNRFENLGTLWNNLMEVLQGKRGIGDLFSGLKDEMDGVGLKFTELPKLSERAMTDVEKIMLGDIARIADEFGEGFEKFYEDKIREMNSGGGDIIEKEAYEVGNSLGESLNEGVKNQIKAMDAVLMGSAESLSRIADYRDMLAQRNTIPNSLTNNGNIGNIPARPTNGAAQAMVSTGQSPKSDAILTQIRDELVKLNNRPVEFFASTDLGG